MDGANHGHARAWIAVLAGTVFLALVPLAWAALDLTGGRHMLFMDETVVLDQVMQIVHPDEGRFLRGLLTGTDHRYGQVTTVVAAAGGVLPWWFGGDGALIVAVRITGAVCLLLGYLLMALAVLRLRPAAGLVAWIALLAVIVLPCTVYYAAMPKPEPVQILALGCFAYTSARRGVVAGWPCAFLGVAVAAKISALPMVAGALLALAWTLPAAGRWPILLRSGAWVGAGLLVSEPAILLKTGSWLRDTVLNTGHGADRPDIGPAAWIAHIHGGPHPFSAGWWMAFGATTGSDRGALPLPGWWLWAQAAVVGVLLVPVLVRLRRAGTANPAHALGLVLTVAGMLYLAAIIVGVHRLWDFYLHPGFVLAAFGAALLLPRPDWARCRWAVGLAALALAGPWIIRGALQAVPAVSLIGTRTAQPGHALQQARYDRVLSLARSVALALGRQPVVVLDPHLWDPGPTAGFIRVHAWGPRRPWEYAGDMLIMGPAQDPDREGDPADRPSLVEVIAAGHPWAPAAASPDDELGLRVLLRSGTVPAP